MTMEESTFQVVVIGGGIAGVSCAEMVSQIAPDLKVLLLSAAPLIKAVTNFRQVTKRLEEFDIVERPLFDLQANCPNITVLQQVVSAINTDQKEVITRSGDTYTYEKLCICSGGVPKVIAEGNPYVFGIRDTETVQVFQKRLKDARRIMVVGNGGIATELVYEVEGCDVIWTIKDTSITSTFIDAGAAEFFLPVLQERKKKLFTLKHTKYTIEANKEADVMGGALGPDWHQTLELHGAQKESSRVYLEYEVEVHKLYTPSELVEASLQNKCESLSEQEPSDWPCYVELTNGKVFGCDFLVSATGVVPNTSYLSDQFALAEDGGIKVDDHMQSSVPGVYAAGDVCTADWPKSPLWQQMRLWSQARQMGAYAARCMTASLQNETIYMDFCFELFAHVTKFFNFKVILLGKFNAQGLEKDHNLLLRVTKGQEYVKTVMKDNRMVGALLIGDTDLEETFENLILNQMDLSQYGEDLLDPNIDIEDYFD